MLSEDLPIHRYAMHGRRAAAPGARKQNAWWDERAGVPRAHPRAPARRRAAARARHRGPRAGRVGVHGGWTNGAQRRPHAGHDVGARATSASRRREGAQRVWDLMAALPAAGRARARSSTARRCTRRAAPLRDPRARRGARPAHPRPLHALPLPGPARRCCASCTQDGTIQPHRGRRPGRRLVDPQRGRRAPAERRLQAAHRAAEPVRQPALRPRPHRGAVRLPPPARDLHAQAQAPLGLLRAPDPRRRQARRPRRPRDGPQARRARRARDPRRAEAPARRSGCRRRSAASSEPRGVARRDERSRFWPPRRPGEPLVFIVSIQHDSAVSGSRPRLTGKFEGVKRHGSSERAAPRHARP